MEATATLISALAALFWPLIVLLLFWRFWPLVAELLRTAKTRRVTVKIAGQEFTLEDAAERQGASLSDLVAQVGTLEKRLDALTAASPIKPAAVPAPLISRVLWVDDNPDNNRLYIAQLEEVGISVDLATATSAALGKFESNPYDAVVSDMGRLEQGAYRDSAGLELVNALRTMDASVPIFIFCSREKARRFGDAAIQAGAADVTSSPTRILAKLGYDERKNARTDRR